MPLTDRINQAIQSQIEDVALMAKSEISRQTLSQFEASDIEKIVGMVYKLEHGTFGVNRKFDRQLRSGVWNCERGYDEEFFPHPCTEDELLADFESCLAECEVLRN